MENSIIGFSLSVSNDGSASIVAVSFGSLFLAMAVVLPSKSIFGFWNCRVFMRHFELILGRQRRHCCWYLGIFTLSGLYDSSGIPRPREIEYRFLALLGRIELAELEFFAAAALLGVGGSFSLMTAQCFVAAFFLTLGDINSIIIIIPTSVGFFHDMLPDFVYQKHEETSFDRLI